MRDILDRRLRVLHDYRRVQRSYDGLVPKLALALALAAVAVIVVRLALPEAEWLIVPAIVVAVLAPLPWLPSLWRQRDRAGDIAGHLDSLCGSEGLAMALAESRADARDQDWLARLRQPLENFQLPAFTWSAGKSAALCAGCLLVAFLLPQAQRPPRLSTMVSNLFAQVDQQFGDIAEAQAMPEPSQEELRQQLAELKQHATDDGMDEATWEGLDRIKKQLDTAGDLAVRRLAQAMVAAEVAAAATEPPAGAAPDSALAQALAELALQAPGLVPVLPEGATLEAMQNMLAQAAQRGLLTPMQLQALQRLGFKPDPGARKLDPGAARAFSKDLLDRLKQGQGKSGLSKDGRFSLLLEGMRALDNPGKGGVNRGPGHVELTFGDKSRTPGGQSENLPTGARINPDGSVTLAEQVRDSEVDEAVAQAVVRAAAQSFGATTADARRAATAPRHRAAVEKYFAADAKGLPQAPPAVIQRPSSASAMP
jgi:hypothetical protein